MGARSGNNFLTALRKLKADVWIAGARVEDPTIHPAFVNCARSIASLYDMQSEHPAAMTYRLDDGGRAGLSFIQPANAEDVRIRSVMFRLWAEYSGGMLECSPDYLNTGLAAMAAAWKFFAGNDARFGDNVQAYYREARNHDWCATHTLADPQPNAAAGTVPIALQLIDRTSDGIVVEGARILATSGALSEELLAFPPTELGDDPGNEKFALAFAINCNAPGLRFLCRDFFDSGRSHFDAPLASRFEQVDCVAIFDKVTVPWDRVFLCGDIARCNVLFAETDAVANMMHQVMVKKSVKAEFLLGLAAKLAEAGNVKSLPHVRERLAEMIVTAELMRSCLRAAEVDAHQNKWGRYAPARPPLEAACNLFPRLYSRMVEIIQLNSSSNLTATPAQADFNSALLPQIDRYLASGGASAKERAALYRLAWDAAGSAFSGRQLLYERSFFGDPARVADALVDNTDLQPLVRRIEDFLKRID